MRNQISTRAFLRTSIVRKLYYLTHRLHLVMKRSNFPHFLKSKIFIYKTLQSWINWINMLYCNTFLIVTNFSHIFFVVAFSHFFFHPPFVCFSGLRKTRVQKKSYHWKHSTKFKRYLVKVKNVRWSSYYVIMHGRSTQRYDRNCGRPYAANIRWAKACWKATTGIWWIKWVLKLILLFALFRF